MLIFGIDPGISGAISIFKNNKFVEVLDMPTMIDGKKKKRQVNGEVRGIIKGKVNTEVKVSKGKVNGNQRKG